jgi:nicotinate-nucleotide adenylyltransferase|tara:strand:+ start:678 stop:1277 length:600 start_codon:yes stop_codon:yes gene_type:complete
LRVGLLGGSFNPAHEGHRRISELALQRLGLDMVWWLVSPQNPLKPHTDMAPFADRLAGAKVLARHPRIRVSDLEARLGTRYSVDTITRLQARHPHTRFVWILGADNLIQLPTWRHWTRFFERVAIAVFDRPSYSHQALAGRAARRYARFRIASNEGHALPQLDPPAWIFLWAAHSSASATALRAATSPPPGATQPENST